MPDSPGMTTVSLDELCVNTVRTLSMDAVQAANSGHPGTPMALAPLAYVLWTRHLRHNPKNPDWADRDRCVLSCGHASMLLYSVLHLTGYGLPLEEIRRFRQLGSRTAGHPEHGLTPGVETTTGPLGQGFANAVGMAMAEAHLAAVYNRGDDPLVDHRTYFIASDGDLMEGISHEAASLAGHLGLGKLIGFYDDNRITIDGATHLTYSEDVESRFLGYGWHVQRVDDGNDLDAIDRAIEEAKRVADRPSLVILRTHIAFGSPNKQDTAEAHGAALGEDEVERTKKNYDWPTLEAFHIPPDARAEWRKCVERGAELEREWSGRRAAYASAHPDELAEYDRRLRGELPPGWDQTLPTFASEDGSVATRGASGKALNALASRVPELIGGSADLSGSVKTLLGDQPAYGAGSYSGRNIFFGVREHAMGGIANGMALHGGVRPYCGTFLIFSDYMRPAIRLAAMMQQPVIYLFSHDSIGLGEDGPTHQPIETLSALRAIPGLVVLRPADAVETVDAWRFAVSYTAGPVALVLSRQGLPVLDRAEMPVPPNVMRGAYVQAEPAGGEPDALILASGSEVSVALEAHRQLADEGIRTRVINMVSHELFAGQPAEYRERILPSSNRRRVAVEAGHPMSWHRWIGLDGAMVGMQTFGASAPARDLFTHFGITARAVVAHVRELLER